MFKPKASMTPKTGKEQPNPLLRGFLVVLIGIGLCLALLVLLSNLTELTFENLLSGPYFWQAILLEILALALFVLSWYVLIFFGGHDRISIIEASAHIGITLIGKYLPGKVWGLIGRTYLLKQRNYSIGAAVELLLADQFLTFYTGIFLASLALLAIYNLSLFTLAFILFLLANVLVSLFYGDLISRLMLFMKVLFKRVARIQDTSGDNHASTAVNKTNLSLAMLVYLTHWMATSVVLLLLFYPSLQSALQINCLLLFAAIPLGVLSGFLAVWAPGGIGVREAVIVGILAINLPLELAASIAITYRLICVINDLATGAIALAYYGGSGLQLLRTQQP